MYASLARLKTKDRLCVYRSSGAGVDANPDLEAEVEVVLNEDAGRDEN